VRSDLFLPEADEEFREAARYCESEAPGLGIAFITEVHSAVASVVANPYAAAAAGSGIRRKVLHHIKRVANRAQISRPVTPHVLRHTFSVTVIQKGISLPALQRLLGHDRLTTTEIYLNLSPEDLIREFQAKW
jgi:integrase/recombinase XerD